MIKLIRDLWTIHAEAAKVRRAYRQLTKDEWALEFLVLLLVKASSVKKLGCHIVLKNKDGQELHLTSDAPIVQEQVESRPTVDVLSDQVKLEHMLNAAWARGQL